MLIRRCLALVFVMLFASSILAVPAQALTNSDFNSLYNNTPFYDPSDNTGACSEGSTITNLVGSDNPQKAFNYFRAKGLDDMHAAAVVGNLMLESGGVNPLLIEGGKESKDPADAGGGGWGIAQWTPGAKVIDIAKNLGINGPIYELSTQLDVVWAEMTGTAPTGYQDVVTGLKQQSTLPAAVEFFRANFESGIDFEDRLKDAQQALDQYGGSPSAVVSPNDTSGAVSSTGCGPGAVLSPDCQNAAGAAKILCAAKQYDTVSYSETTNGGHQGAAAWHNSCPVIGPSCILDCSGLVNIAIYDVYGTDLQENTDSERADTKNWKQIPFNEVQPGDLIQPNTGHVEIIDHVQGSTIYTFGAHSSSYPQPRQVSPSSFPVLSSNLYLRYVGSGAGQ